MRRSHADSSISVPRRADGAEVDWAAASSEAKTEESAPSVAWWNIRPAFIRWRMACIIGSVTWTTAVSVPKRASLRRHAASP